MLDDKLSMRESIMADNDDTTSLKSPLSKSSFYNYQILNRKNTIRPKNSSQSFFKGQNNDRFSPQVQREGTKFFSGTQAFEIKRHVPPAVSPLGKCITLKSEFMDNQSDFSSYNLMSPEEKINIEKFYEDLSKELLK